MKRLLYLTISLIFATFYLQSQTIVDPSTFPAKSSADGTEAIYTREDAVNRKLKLSVAKKYLTPDVQTTTIGYEPAATGNTLNLMEFVKHTTSGKIWYIDSAGDAFLLRDSTIAIADGDYGDITFSSSGTVATIDAGAVGADELAITGVLAGTYGSSTLVPVVTVDQDGRVTNVSTVAVSGGGGSLSDGDKGDIDVTGSGTTWTIDTSAVTTLEILDNTIAWGDLSTAVQDSISAGGDGIDTISGGYAYMRALSGANLSRLVLLNDWTKTAPSGEVLNCIGGFFKKITPGSKTENGATVIVLSDGTTFERQWDHLYVKPEWWEPGGYDEEGNIYTSFLESDEGIYDDGDRVKAALNYCAVIETDASVELESRLYEITLLLTMKNPYNVKLIGNGATIKRKPPPVTTTLTATSTSVDFVRVASVTGFRVGSRIIVTDSTGAQGGFASAEHNEGTGTTGIRYIRRISGDTLFVGNSAGDTLHWETEIGIGNSCSISSTILNSVNNARIENVIFDGNRQENQVNYDWKLNKGIFCLTDPFSDRRVSFENVTFKNMPGACVSGGGFYTFQNTKVFNTVGGLFHNSLSPDTPETVVHVYNLFADSIVVKDRALTGHDEAIFTFSAGSGNLYVTNAEVRNLFGNVWGDQNFSHTDVYISHSNFEGKSGTNQKIANVTATSSTVNERLNIHLSHVNFSNCGDLVMNGSAVARETINGFNISHCKFVNSRLVINNAVDFVIDNCDFFEKPGLGDFVSYDTGVILNTVVYEALILIRNSDHFQFTNNKVLGDRQYNKHTAVGLYLLNSANFRIDSLGVDTKIYYESNQNISGNLVAGVSWGIAGTNIRGPGATETPLSGLYVGIKIDNNRVFLERKARNEFAARPFYGVYGGPGYIISNNYVVMPDSAATTTEAGLCLGGVTAAVNTEIWGATAYGNQIYSLADKPSIRGADPRGTGGHNNIIYNNLYTGTLTSMENDYNVDNKRMDATMLPNLSSPVHPVYSQIHQFYETY